MQVTNEDILNNFIDIFQLTQTLNKKSFEDIYNGLNINEVHAIDYIKKNTHANVTNISSALNITRSGTTKLTKKLISTGHITEYKVKENKKEKYFSLTIDGEKIFIKHQKFHAEAIKKDSKLFENFTNNEKLIIIEFLDILKNDLKMKLTFK